MQDLGLLRNTAQSQHTHDCLRCTWAEYHRPADESAPAAQAKLEPKASKLCTFIIEYDKHILLQTVLHAIVVYARILHVKAHNTS